MSSADDRVQEAVEQAATPERTEPVLDRDTVDLLRTIIRVSRAVHDEGIPMPYATRALLTWAADEASKRIRDWEQWIAKRMTEERNRGQTPDR